MISGKDLSVVIQGPFYPVVTGQCIASIRRYFPGSEIIVSTWENQKLEAVDCDKLITSKDPGSLLRDDTNKLYHNANRQIVSTINGLKQASRTYALKMRSDLIVLNHNILGLLADLAQFDAYDPEWKFLKQRALVTNITSTNPFKTEPIPFHPCDWIYGGLTEDLLKIWDIPLCQEPEISRWYETHPKPADYPFPTSLALFHPENYIWSSFVRKYHPIDYKYMNDTSGSNLQDSMKSLANNVVIYSNQQLGIKSPKHHTCYVGLYRMYTHADWLNLYHRYSKGTKTYFIGFDNVLSWFCFTLNSIWLKIKKVLKIFLKALNLK